NDLIINKLPVTFKGFFDFIENGYNMNFTLDTFNSNLHDLFTALPPEYVDWLKKTQIKGSTNAHFSLIGKYIVSQNYKPDVNFDISIKNGFVSHLKASEPAQNIYLNLKTRLPSLDINKLEVNLDSIYFTVGRDYFKSKIKTEGFGKKMAINSLIQSKIDLSKLQRAIGYNEFKIKGNLTTDIIAQGKLDLDSKVFPVTKGKMDLNYGSLQTKFYPKPIENITIQSFINSPTSNLKDAEIKLSPVQLTFEGKPFKISGSLKNIEDVNYDLKIDGILNLSKIYKVFSQKGLDFEGLIDSHLSLAGKQSDATSGKINNLKNSGTLHLKDIKITSQYLPKPFYINDGLFVFNQDKMNFSNFKGKYESSDILMNGYLQNVINFVMSKNEILKGSFQFYSKYLNINELTTSSNNNIDTNSNPATEKPIASAASDKIIEVPKNFDLSFLLKSDRTQFDDVKIKDLNGLISIKNGTLILKNASLNIIDCKANMNLTYKNINSEKASFSTQIKASEFDIKRAYNEIEMFRKMVTSAKNAEGIISLNYNLNGVLNKKMEPIYPSLVGNGSLTVKNVKFNGYKLMNVIASKTENSDLKDPNIEDIVINTKIKNNIINIERFKFKTSGFRIRFEGQASFDGKLNLKTRIGLPPLGIIGVPLKIQGTQEKPKIKIGSKSQDLQGTEF
ncbi:MAG: AsmA-like C-terminal region-containing protein, partial [Limnohabitans sp.]|nr:AsmA-like C-terminal region-containing protein [Limnohabitans sp.]